MLKTKLGYRAQSKYHVARRTGGASYVLRYLIPFNGTSKIRNMNLNFITGSSTMAYSHLDNGHSKTLHPVSTHLSFVFYPWTY